MPRTGFAGLSRRNLVPPSPTTNPTPPLRKPILAAIHGACLGGGFEAALNCDIVLASPDAVFALPEVKVGVVALAGALPRLVRTVGRQRAMEMAVTGRGVRAEEMKGWGVVNEVVSAASDSGAVGDGDAGEAVTKRAIEVAEMICRNSPDSVLVSKFGVEMGWAGIGVEEATERVTRDGWGRMEGGENMREGVKAFVEKRRPRWKDSKL
ncbi:MAG: hypothetical protein Q9219_003287 [cf. Caloplaca sp. 3 TL-2023]